MMNEIFNFDNDIVKALKDINSIPTTEPNAIPGIPGPLFIIAPEQKIKLENIVTVLDNVPPEKFATMSDAEKLFYSSLLNNAETILRNCICRPTREHFTDRK